MSNAGMRSPSCDPKLGVEMAVLERSTGDELEEGSIVCLSSTEDAVEGLLSFPLDGCGEFNSRGAGDRVKWGAVPVDRDHATLARFEAAANDEVGL